MCRSNPGMPTILQSQYQNWFEILKILNSQQNTVQEERKCPSCESLNSEIYSHIIFYQTKRINIVIACSSIKIRKLYLIGNAIEQKYFPRQYPLTFGCYYRLLLLTFPSCCSTYYFSSPFHLRKIIIIVSLISIKLRNPFSMTFPSFLNTFSHLRFFPHFPARPQAHRRGRTRKLTVHKI